MNPSIFLILLLTAFIWGITPIVEKIALKTADPVIGVTIRSIIVTVTLMIVLLLTNRTKELMTLSFKEIILFGISGLLSGLLAMWLYFKALKMGATSQVIPLGSTYPLFTMILSVIILRENLTIPNIIGTIFIVIGIWFITGFKS